MEERNEPETLAAAMLDRARLQLGVFRRHLPGGDREAYDREEKVVRFTYQLKWAVELVADPSVGLLLLHLQVPHPPVIYRRVSSAVGARPGSSYLDNVALAIARWADCARRWSKPACGSTQRSW